MKPLPETTSLDLTHLAGLYRSGMATPSQVVDLVYRRIEANGENSVWLHLTSRHEAMERAKALEAGKAGGSKGKGNPDSLPLFGVPFAVKDNFDVADTPTTAACPAFAYTARETAFAVERIVAAGGILIGKTNMDQFATGLVGTRTPYGRIGNPFDPDFIPGGSSSGSAVAVALGCVSFALGTDTAGSGRVPAAFNNIVGLKPSRGLISCSGVVPACRSLDCVSIFALTTQDAAEVMRTATAYDPTDPFARRDVAMPDKASFSATTFPAATVSASRRATPFRFGIPLLSQLRFYGDIHAERLYRDSLERLAEAGGECVEIDYSPFLEAAQALYDGPFVAERLEAARFLLQSNPGAIHPVTRGILESAKRFSALDLFLAQSEFPALRKRAEQEWRKMDVLALPTTGTLYTHAQVEANPVELNTNLGYYTNFVNLLDACALALPSGFRPDGLPAGITLIAPALQEPLLFDLGTRFQNLTRLPLGATGSPVAQTPLSHSSKSPLKSSSPIKEYNHAIT